MLSKVEPRFTAMAAAFYIATIHNPRSRVCKRVGRAIERNAGLVRERSVDAHLSRRTATQLTNQGVL